MIIIIDKITATLFRGTAEIKGTIQIVEATAEIKPPEGKLTTAQRVIHKEFVARTAAAGGRERK